MRDGRGRMLSAADSADATCERLTGMDVSKGWEHRATVVEGEPVQIAGIDPWNVEWTAVPVTSVVVAHPTYSAQRHSMTVYRLSGVEPPALFAAGEFSNAVWGFYEPTESMREFLLTRLT